MFEEASKMAKCFRFMDMNLFRERYIEAVDKCIGDMAYVLPCMGRHLEFSLSEEACYSDIVAKEDNAIPSFFGR
ncbi:unnamed protein product [Ixodes persulcatus]